MRSSSHLPNLADGETAVDGDDFSRDVFGGGGAEEDDGSGAVLGLADAAEEDFLFVVHEEVVGAGLHPGAGERGADEAGGDAIDADAERGQ